MTTPDVPYRLEFSVEVPGTPEQVWAAIATTTGISSWFLPTEIDEHEGGSFVAHMGVDDSPGTVTGWDPPRRLVVEEPEWPRLMGHPDAVATPLASEFLVEARSGGTCVVRVVSSAFGTGAGWEPEMFAGIERYWPPYFRHHLRMYLERFAGQRATTVDVAVDLPGPHEAVRQVAMDVLGATEVGRPVEVLGLAGTVDRVAEPFLVVRVDRPVPGYVSLHAIPKDEGTSSVQMTAWLFGDGATAYAEQARPEWRGWLEGLVPAVRAATSGSTVER